jgi:hypothetical protein
MDTSLNLVSDAKSTTDFARTYRLGLVGSHRIPGHYGHSGKSAQGADEILGQSVSKIVSRRIATLVHEGKNREHGFGTNLGRLGWSSAWDEAAEEVRLEGWRDP